jgi:hypothetical protein
MLVFVGQGIKVFWRIGNKVQESRERIRNWAYDVPGNIGAIRISILGERYRTEAILMKSTPRVFRGKLWTPILLALTACGESSSSTPPPPPAMYSVGGYVAGLTGSGLTLEL